MGCRAGEVVLLHHDVIAALTGNDRPRKYWNDLKSKLLKEGSELSDKMGPLKMPANDGKNYMTDVAVASCLAMTSRAALPAGPSNPIVQGRVPQEVVGASGFGSLGRDHIETNRRQSYFTLNS